MQRIHPRIVVATRVQLDAWREALAGGADRVGWKIALGIDEVEALVGSDPVLGHITTATLLEPGGTVAGSPAIRRLRAETELAVEVGPDETVARLAVALDIVETGRPPNGLAEIYCRQRLPPPSPSGRPVGPRQPPARGRGSSWTDTSGRFPP
jgi:hypothetical protein